MACVRMLARLLRIAFVRVYNVSDRVFDPIDNILFQTIILNSDFIFFCITTFLHAHSFILDSFQQLLKYPLVQIPSAYFKL